MKRDIRNTRSGISMPAALISLLLLPAAGESQEVTEPVWRRTTVEKVPHGEWRGARLPDGQPDIQGFWSNVIANHDNFTDPQAGIPGDPLGIGGGSAADFAAGRRRPDPPPRSARAPSRVSDPASGEVPFQPWARARQEELLANFFDPTRPEHIEPNARCAPAGPTKSLYFTGYEIRQYDRSVLFIFYAGSRLIHLDDKPHLADDIKLWNADSRGHWDGNTLVVSVRNNNSKWRFARTGEFASENLVIQERYTFSDDGEQFTYEATYTDPTVFTRPFTVTIPSRRTTRDWPIWHNVTELANHPDGTVIAEPYERLCVENNGNHAGLVGEGTHSQDRRITY